MGTFFLCVGLRACLQWPQGWTSSNWPERWEPESQPPGDCRDPWAGCFWTESLLIRALFQGQDQGEESKEGVQHLREGC